MLNIAFWFRIIEVRAPQRPEIRTATPKSSNNMRYESEESDENSSKVSSSQSSPDSKGSQYLQASVHRAFSFFSKIL